MKHSSTPAWTMGTRSEAERKTSDKYNPGPGTYTVREEPPKNGPSCVFGASARPNVHVVNEYPGPGQYTLPAGFTHKPAGKTNKRLGRQRLGSRDKPTLSDTPGPGAYHPREPVHPLQFSMGNKTYSLSPAGESAVGPGQYRPNYQAIQSAKLFTFGTGKRSNLHTFDKTLGPRSYNLPEVQLSPSYSFGKSHRESRNYAAQLPSPCQYQIESGFNGKQAKTMAAKNSMQHKDAEVPGPGSYQAEVTPRVTTFSLKKAKRNTALDQTNFARAGPGAYSPVYPTHGSRKTSFGTSKRPPLASQTYSPGPGAYSPQAVLKEPLQYTMAGKKNSRTPSGQSPGPGQYSPQSSVGNGPVIGTGQRSNIAKSRPQTNPGPAHYFSATTISGPKWSFGRDLREKFEEDPEPGPGQYTILPTVPDVPRYLLPSNRENQWIR